jgi:hypothetical protein
MDADERRYGFGLFANYLLSSSAFIGVHRRLKQGS